MQYIDIGVNLTNKSLMADLDAILHRARAAGVEQMVVTGTSIDESRRAIRLCEDYPDRLVCTAGLHPHHASDWREDSGEVLRSLAEQPCVRAIGEAGLDFNRNYSPRDAQINAFRQQLELAVAMQKPVFAHQRDAHAAFIEVLRDYRDRLVNIVVHCFTDNRAALQDYLTLDCHIGVTGWICDERRGTELAELVQYIPANRLMAETDAPYLLPRDLPGKPKTRINEPANLPHIVESIARHQCKPLEQLATECLQTTRDFFGL